MSKHKKHKNSHKVSKSNVELPKAPMPEMVPEIYSGIGCGTYAICFLFMIPSIIFATTTFI